MSNENKGNDFFYAEILNMMRSQGGKDNPVILQIGIMQSANSVKVDDLILYAEDLYIADYLTAGYTRELKTPYVSEVSSNDTAVKTTKQDTISYSNGLKKGDLVAVQQINDTNKYVILAKVVQAE